MIHALIGSAALASHFTAYFIDDNNWHAELVRTLLDDEVFSLTHWFSPRDAWNGINTYPSPDLVILDLDPEGQFSSGIGFTDLLDHLRVQWSRVPVIVLSDNPNPEIVRRGKSLGIEAFIGKPYDIRLLLSAVYDILNDILKTHIAMLNRQHVHLSRRFQQLRTSTVLNAAETGKLLQTLAAHFRFEEDFMADHNYPELTAHAKAHAQLLQRARKLLRPNAATPDAIASVWRGITSDINDDGDYVRFLEGIRRGLESRLEPSAAASCGAHERG